LLNKVTLCLAIAAATLPAIGRAEQPRPLELAGYVKIEMVTVAPDGGREVQLVDPDVIVPGDRLVFGIRFANRGSERIENVVVTNPLPPTVTFAADADPALVVSVDGGTTWGQRSELEVTGADGSRRAALPEDVGHVRWTLAEVPPGASGHLEFPVVVR
jgi:uncharacterized repeat protein (TIGR01451 family)